MILRDDAWYKALQILFLIFFFYKTLLSLAKNK